MTPVLQSKQRNPCPHPIYANHEYITHITLALFIPNVLTDSGLAVKLHVKQAGVIT